MKYKEAILVQDGEDIPVRIYGETRDAKFEYLKEGKWVRAKEPIGIFFGKLFPKENK